MSIKNAEETDEIPPGKVKLDFCQIIWLIWKNITDQFLHLNEK